MNTNTNTFVTTPNWIASPQRELAKLYTAVRKAQKAYDAASIRANAISSAVWGDGQDVGIEWNGITYLADRNDAYESDALAADAYAVLCTAQTAFADAMGWLKVGCGSDREFTNSVAVLANVRHAA